MAMSTHMQDSGLEESFRWYGPQDGVTLRDIRQTGATSVMSSLHDIAYGEVWSRLAIQHHKVPVVLGRASVRPVSHFHGDS